MTRETRKATTKKATAKTKTDTAHCGHCGVAVELNSEGNAETHGQANSKSHCPGTGYPPLTI